MEHHPEGEAGAEEAVREHMADNLTPEQRSRAMKAIKFKGTSIETSLGKELWRRGLRFDTNVDWIDGRPDIVFIRRKVAVFCDGEFWHG